MTSTTPEATDKKNDQVYDVAINGTAFSLDRETVTYEELGQLAFPGHDPQALFTVTYKNAHSPRGGDGTLVAGESVKVKKKGTTFNVRLSTRS